MNGSARSKVGSASSAKQLALIFLLFTLPAPGVSAADAPHAAPQCWPFWDGQETIEHYAKRANLPPTRTLDLGGGVSMEFVLIPAGRFIMGTPKPESPWVGGTILGLSSLIVLGLIAGVAARAIIQRTRFQFSLRWLILVVFLLAIAEYGGFRCWRAVEASRDFWAGASPAHEVTVTKPFYMGKYTVTQEQWQQVMGWNPSHFKGANLPVETVSWWDDVQEFCKKASSRPLTPSPLTPERSPRGGEGKKVRLPTEAEWEYACRAGTVTAYNTGDTEADLDQAAWYRANSKRTTHPVGQKKPNAWGLYDMHGNVWQWCQDWYGYEGYQEGAAVDPQGPDTGIVRVLRGGSWIPDPEFCRAANRSYYQPGIRNNDIGYRVVVLVARIP